MKRIVWIPVLLLATLTVAYGQVAEAPLPSGLPTYGPGVAPVVVVEPAVAQPPEAAPPPIHSTPAVRRVLGPAPGPVAGMMEAPPPAQPEAPGYGMTPGTPWHAIGGQGAVMFTLFDPEKGVRYGPFPLRTGGPIAVGGVEYHLEVVGLAPPPEEERTREQLNLEERLRKTLIPDLFLEGSGIMDAVDLLSAQGEVNIVVTEVVQKSGFNITLRLRNIPLYDAIRYVAEVADIGFRIDDHAVVITDEVPRPVMVPMPVPGVRR
ncbi:MAG: hypothetical protein Q8Q12_20680 [bacterium]|nr:hypothetical protein [bacterium]